MHSLGHDQQTYTSLKNALLKKYQCTAQEYAKNFRQATPLESQDIDSFVTRLKMLFDAWIDLDGCKDKSFHQLRDLILRDQLYRSLDEEVVTFVKERTPKTVEEVLDIIYSYVDAHPSKPLGKRFNVGNASLSKTINASDNHYKDNKPEFVTHEKTYNGNYSNRYNQDHSPNFRENRWSRRDFNGTRRRYNSSHWHDRRTSSPPRSNDYNRQWNSRNNYYSPQGRPSFRPQNEAHVSAALSTKNNRGLPLYQCTIGNIAATCLRDTGSNVNAVSSQFVNHKQYTGRYSNCTMFDGSSKTFPIAKIRVDTPFISGVIDVLVIGNPITDLIIGNGEHVANSALQNNVFTCAAFIGNEEIPTSCRETKQRDLHPISETPLDTRNTPVKKIHQTTDNSPKIVEGKRRREDKVSIVSFLLSWFILLSSSLNFYKIARLISIFTLLSLIQFSFTTTMQENIFEPKATFIRERHAIHRGLNSRLPDTSTCYLHRTIDNFVYHHQIYSEYNFSNVLEASHLLTTTDRSLEDNKIRLLNAISIIDWQFITLLDKLCNKLSINDYRQLPFKALQTCTKLMQLEHTSCFNSTRSAFIHTMVHILINVLFTFLPLMTYLLSENHVISH